MRPDETCDENPFRPLMIDLDRRKGADHQPADPRQQAHAAVRWTLVLLIPAVMNDIALSAAWVSRLPNSAAVIVVAFHIGFFLSVALLMWFFVFRVLELFSEKIRATVAANVDPVRWQHVFYKSTGRLRLLLLFGVLLWMIWIAAIFAGRLNFLIVSVLIGIPAHILGAVYYLPLFWQWYKLRRDSGRAFPNPASADRS
ncbi:MAG: hypothetical protein KDA91_07410 [Planctomycetaceae bacterium]|nr:hypothetical protein [Planctomycetaceae bacterium]